MRGFDFYDRQPAWLVLYMDGTVDLHLSSIPWTERPSWVHTQCQIRALPEVER